jgi:osmotically-inducible protein OsmY
LSFFNRNARLLRGALKSNKLELQLLKEVFMNKSLLSAVFVLVIALLYASAQTGNASGSGNAQNSTQPSQGAQSGQEAASTQTGNANPAKPSANVPGAVSESSGGIAGAAGSAPENTQTPERPSAAAAPSDSDLQAEVQNALSKEPTLSGDSVNVAVSADSIDITGTVTTAREKQTATRIVQSYAGNKKVVSHLTVTGRNRNSAPGGVAPKETREEKGTGSGDLSTHPEPNKGAPPATSSRPPG